MTMENGSQPLIRLDAVSKVFVTDEVETHALQSIHFDVKKGEYLSISGPSGCGKSTLLAILGLLDTPTDRSEEHTSELQSLRHLVCRLLLEKKNKDRELSRRMYGLEAWSHSLQTTDAH